MICIADRGGTFLVIFFANSRHSIPFNVYLLEFLQVTGIRKALLVMSLALHLELQPDTAGVSRQGYPFSDTALPASPPCSRQYNSLLRSSAQFGACADCVDSRPVRLLAAAVA